jgi:uroporphyrinogen III methyltransferase/synthase
MVASLENLGAEVIEYPAIAIESLAPPELGTMLPRFDRYNWLIFTSANGVREFLNQVFDLGFDIRDLKGPKVCAIGPATAGELEDRGIKVAVVPEEYRAEGMADALREHIAPGDRVLLARARGSREVLPAALRALEAEVEVLELYQAVPAAAGGRTGKEYLEDGLPDMITFTSSSTVRNFVALAGAETVAKLRKNAAVACIGPITAETARAEGFRIDVEAEVYTIDGLIDAIVHYYSRR